MRKLLSLLAVLMLCTALVSAQNRTITGQVRDENGKPVPFATVQVKGDLTGVSADAQGNFKINAQTKDVLVISAVNFSSKEFAVPASGPVTISLQTIAKTETEVVVTAQGVRRRPKELGYSVARVSNADITNGHSPRVAEALSGKVSGLAVYNVNNSVDPTTKITLRGYRSLSGNNDALIVIDGLPMPIGSTSGLSVLNPNDIDNVSILKGGVAATLYGSDGSNGAIIITTKRGIKGKPRISYSNATNIEKINQILQFQNKYGSGSHYAAGYGTANWKPNYLDRMKDNWRSYENQQYGDAFDGSTRLVGRTLQDGSTNMLPYSNIAGERERIWNTGLTVNNQASVSGGNDVSTFYASLENNLTWGIVPEDRASRTGLRFAGTTQTNKLKVGYSGGYVQTAYDRTTFGFYNETINQAGNIPLSQYRDWRNNKFASPNAYYNDYYTNPYFRLDNERVKYQDANLNGNVELTYKLTNWLTLYNKTAAMNNSRTQKNTVGKFIHSDWAKTKAIVPAGIDQGDGAGITRAGTDFLGSVSDNISNENVLSNEFQLQFEKSIKNISIKGLTGFSVYDRRTRSVTISSSSLVVPDVYNVDNRLGNLGGGESTSHYRKFGYYADAMFGWKDLVFLHAVGRYDVSSKFYKPDRPSNMYSYFYPGVDVSVILTEAFPGIKNNILSYAKLRAGYNKNGNDNLGGITTVYGLDATYPNSANFPYGNTVGVTVGDIIPDKDLKPEFIRSFEVGGEFQFLKNRINLDMTYYTQKSEGQVVSVTIPRTTGFGTLRINVGETKNWGFETDLKVQIIKNTNFSWDVNARYSYNNNKVLKLYNGVSEFQLAGYAYASAYVIQDQPYPVMKALGYVRDSLNRIVVNKATGYPINNGPLKNFGRTTPPHMFGFGTNAKYKGLTLSANLEYRGGNVIYSDLGRQMTFTGSGKWTEDRAPFIVGNSSYNDGTGKFVPNDVKVLEAEYSYYYDYYRIIAENFVVPAWFIKLRDISLAYDLPKGIMSKMKVFSGITVGLYGRNLFTIVDKRNQFTDPEFSFTATNGIGVSNTDQTPPVRQYGFTVNVTFK